MTVIKNIDKWFEHRGFFDDREAISKIRSGQMLKLSEEMGELAGNVARGRLPETKDDIGDIAVVLIGMARLCGHDFEECMEYAYSEIKDRKGRMVDGVFVKEQDL